MFLLFMQRKKDSNGTKLRILNAANIEFSKFGLTAASLNNIVKQSKVTKGALFHHFTGKADLANQWMKEIVTTYLTQKWLEPLSENNDPIKTLLTIFKDDATNPLSIIASSLHEESSLFVFQQIYQLWIQAISDSLKKGQLHKFVHPNIKPDDEAHLIAVISLGYNITASLRSSNREQAFLRSTQAYLETLKPA
jgi:TetR/AcrR family transcriptional regulator, transcriptional repressor for nem operon